MNFLFPLPSTRVAANCSLGSPQTRMDGVVARSQVAEIGESRSRESMGYAKRRMNTGENVISDFYNRGSAQGERDQMQSAIQSANYPAGKPYRLRVVVTEGRWKGYLVRTARKDHPAPSYAAICNHPIKKGETYVEGDGAGLGSFWARERICLGCAGGAIEWKTEAGAASQPPEGGTR